MSLDFRTLAPIDNLKQRAGLLSALRAFFDERGFVEVQTPTLSRHSIIDRHLDPIRVPLRLAGEQPTDWFLQTSPEQSMKRLLACGLGNIYQLGPVFRDGELGRYHNPEFTMAEWYEVDADLEDGLTTLDGLLQRLLKTVPAVRIRFHEAFEQATSLALYACSVHQLAKWSVGFGLVEHENWSDDWDDWVNLIFSMVVQPKLGIGVPLLVTHFPVSQAALARVCPTDPRTAERFELFYQGVELANGYHELTDAELLRARAIQANQQRLSDGRFAISVENPVLDAMRNGLPNSCGCALGFDRVVMLACGAKSLEEVIAFTARNA